MQAHQRDRDQTYLSAIFRREAILEAIGFAAEQFLRRQNDGFQTSMDAVLARLGIATQVSRVYIFENSGPEDQLLMNQRYEWAAPGIEPQIDNPELQGLPYDDLNFQRWQCAFSQGEPIYGLIRDFPDQEREVLEPQDILALVVVPIFVGPRWWGFIGFDDCLDARAWSAAEVDALRAAAGIIGAAIHQEHTRLALLAAHEQLQRMYDLSRDEVRLLSAPLLPIADNVLLLPIVGLIDDAGRAQVIREAILHGVHNQQARMIILDVTGLHSATPVITETLVTSSQAAALMGTKVLLTGIRPDMARGFLDMGAALYKNDFLVVLGTLQQGIIHALTRCTQRKETAL